MKPTSSVSMGPSSNLDAIANDQQIHPACTGESMPMSFSEHIYSQCAVGSALTTSVFMRDEGSDQKEGRVGLAESALIPGCTDGAALDKHLPESAQTKYEAEKALHGQRKHKHKKGNNLPRRASKRLAGIKVDPVPELKTKNRVRRVSVKESGEGEVITNVDKPPTYLPNCATKQLDAVEGGLDTKCKFDSYTNTMELPKSGLNEYSYDQMTIEEHGTDKDQECFSFWPMENQATVKEHVRVLEHGDIVDAKLDNSLDFPLGELLTDPCIAFAIETLTGVTFETYRNSQTSSETLAATEGHNKKIKVQNMGNEKEGCDVFSAPENLTIPRKHTVDAEIGNNANENSGSCSKMPLDISWMDPCIEFAIKTLTGNDTIPLDTDPNSKNCLQRQLSSSSTQGHCEMAL